MPKITEFRSGQRVEHIFFFFQAEDGIRDLTVTGVQTCALPISDDAPGPRRGRRARSLAEGSVALQELLRSGPGLLALRARQDDDRRLDQGPLQEIGRASCRERV